MSDFSNAVIVLRPEEGKQLIGEAIAQLPQVQAAKDHGRLVITGGTTCRYVVQALLGEDPGSESFAVGWINNGELGETPAEGRGPGPFFVDEGTVARGWPGPVLEKFQAGDVYIKGANAIDADGNVGILMASPVGGTIGAALSIVLARGAELVMPVSLQKLIPSIAAVGGLLGHGKVEHFMGTPVGYMPIMGEFATVVTELEALDVLFNLDAVVVAAGGSGDSVGALSLYVEGAAENVGRCLQWIKALR